MFLSCLEPVTMDKVHYCERFIELMIDLEVRYQLAIYSLKVEDQAIGTSEILEMALGLFLFKVFM